MAPKVFVKLFAICLIVIISICSCSQKKNEPVADYNDTTVTVYGPYKVVKLPVKKGTRIGNPIQLSSGPGDLIFAANQSGEVYTLHDSDGDGYEDSTALYCNVKDYTLRSPVGFAFKEDTVFIGTSQQVRAFTDLNKDGRADSSWIFFDQIPQSEHPYEWTSGLRFGRDGWLYCAITTDSWNAGPAADPKGLRGAIIRISPDGKKFERVATGIRSVPGMSFNAEGDLFFVDNEGGGNPTEELNLLTTNGFYGHNKMKYPGDSMNVIKPAFDLQSEVAPSSIEFNSSTNNFGNTQGDLFVSYYGPGERWTRGSIGRLVIKKNQDNTYSYKEYTIADIPKLSDLAFGKDGNLYVSSHGQSDYWYNVVYNDQGSFYKIIYDSSVNIAGNYTRPKQSKDFAKSSVEMGKQLFAELGCRGCHHVDGTTELLGPNLKDVSKNFSREEMLEEITSPSLRIKPSMAGSRITKKDGSVLLGRVLNADEKKLSFILVGNQVVTVQRSDITQLETEKKSLMFENLVSRLSNEQRNALLDYLQSLR